MDNQTRTLKEIFNKLKLVVAEQLEVRIKEIELDSSFANDLGADKLDIIQR